MTRISITITVVAGLLIQLFLWFAGFQLLAELISEIVEFDITTRMPEGKWLAWKMCF